MLLCRLWSQATGRWAALTGVVLHTGKGQTITQYRRGKDVEDRKGRDVCRSRVVNWFGDG